MKKALLVVALLIIIPGLAGFFFLHKTSKGPVQQESPISSASYSCDGFLSVTASFYEGTTTAPTVPGTPPVPSGKLSVVVNNGTPFWLMQTLSADGARYANTNESIVFWDKGNGALFKQDGQKDFGNCVKIAENPGNLSQVYASTTAFSIRYPDGFTAKDSYRYEALGPGKGISGVKFSISSALTQGTNLSVDSYVSVEQLATSKECTASLFMQDGTTAKKVTDGDTDYSVGDSTDAAAGNRYHEIVYAIPGTNPCRAIRYFIHYGVFENYPEGSIKQFDEQGLIKQFDSIRNTLILAS